MSQNGAKNDFCLTFRILLEFIFTSIFDIKISEKILDTKIIQISKAEYHKSIYTCNYTSLDQEHNSQVEIIFTSGLFSGNEVQGFNQDYKLD